MGTLCSKAALQVYLKHNFTQLCQPQITFQKANDAVKDFIKQEDVNIELLCQYL